MRREPVVPDVAATVSASNREHSGKYHQKVYADSGVPVGRFWPSLHQGGWGEVVQKYGHDF